MINYLNHKFNTDDFNLVSIIDELPLWSAPFGLDLLSAVRLKPNTKALDIGCGLGFPAIELAMRLGETGRVYGIDPWERAIERVNLKKKVMNIENVEIILGVAENLPFRKDFFDLLVSNNGLNNVEDMKLSLAECSRVAKPGAQFVLTFNLENTMMEFYNVFEKVLRESGLVNETRKMKDQIYSKRKPLKEVIRMLEMTGFEIKNIKHNSFKFDFLDGSTMFNHYLIKYWFLGSWKNIIKQEDQEYIFGAAEKELNSIASEKGLISLTIPYVVLDCIRLSS